MRMLEAKIYPFNELSDTAKEQARNWFRSSDNFEHESEYVIEQAKDIATIIGIDISNIWYSGFASQGDGACFEGSYSYRKGSVKEIGNYGDCELTAIVKGLRDMQRKHLYSISASVQHRGHYYHSMCTDISVNSKHELWTDSVEGECIDLLRDFMNWIYSQLQTSYDFTQSDDYVDDAIIANEYEFYIEGNIV